MKDKNRVDPNRGRGADGEEMGGVARGETVIRICYARESKCNFNKRKMKKEERQDGINPAVEFHQENSRERVCP